MKTLKIVLVSLLVLIIVLAVAVVIFIKTFDVNRYKPQIIEQAKAALNRDMDFDKAALGISLTQGVSLQISGLTIGENPAFKKGEFLKVQSVSVGVDVLGYLMRKKISVSGIRIDSPRVTIIRSKEGSINAASFGQAGAAVQKPGQIALPAILISSLKINNGMVTYRDESFEPPLSLDVTGLNIAVSSLSLTDPFSFSVEAAVLSDKQNIKLEGKAQVNAASGEITVSDVTGAADLSDIVMAKIPVAFPMTKGAILPQSLHGKIDVKLDAMKAGAKGLVSLKAGAILTDGVLQFKELLSPVKDITANVTLTQQDILMDKASLSVGAGTIAGSGSLKDYSATQGFSMALDMRNITVQDLVVQDKSPVKVEGIVSGPVTIKGEGFTPDAIKTRLTGTADISIAHAKLKDLNVLRTVLDKLSVIPGLSQSIETALPAKYQQKLSQKDTEFSDIKLPVTIQNGAILIKDMVVASEDFTFKGQAEAGFDAAYAVEGSFLISPELSGIMVSAVSQLQYLLNADQQIYIPLKVSGAAGDVKFNVDANYIGRKLIENQAKQQLFKALDKVFK